MASQNSETVPNTNTININESNANTFSTKDIWSYVNKGAALGHEHYKASCKWCTVTWDRGWPSDMRIHLARQCLNVSDNIKYFWRDFIVEEKNSIRKKLKYDQSEITTHFQKIESIPEA
ncbi:35299_t:CDS:2 [Gigaspora margarita]|uniref:35299_t:CDS:1 n=1 Tax=Gigaspora margarita TaxID=4874 RepID=A0ABN7VV23_GIGMA|nr:35299_t:CDS:2 [Gigaspora margarita]